MSATSSWTNWGRNQTCTPARIVQPSNPEEVREAVLEALDRGWSIRAAGTGHSVMPIVGTEGLLIDPRSLSGVSSIDEGAQSATVLAGTPIRDLGKPFWEAGLALANQGDIDVQTIAGATSTATKGSGVNYTNLAARVSATELVDGLGDLVTIGAEDPAHRAAQVSLGLLGVITQLTVQLQPRYYLREQNRVVPRDQLLEEWDELKRAHRHFSFWWMPNDRAHSLYGLPPVPADYAFVKVLDGVDVGEGEEVVTTPEGRIGPAYLVYPETTFEVPFIELEYMVPAEADKEVFAALRDLMLNQHPDADSPIQIRWQKADSAWLSSQYGRDSVSVSVSGVKTTDYLPFLQDVHNLLRSYEARPHWGKWNAFTADDVNAAVPRWADFHDVRRRFDPHGVFLNDYFAALVRT